MFNSLNDEIRKSEGVEPPTSRLLRYAGIVAASILAFSALYAGILFLE
jgi:hypothetical protein